jgi:hypothetical protein
MNPLYLELIAQQQQRDLQRAAAEARHGREAASARREARQESVGRRVARWLGAARLMLA